MTTAAATLSARFRIWLGWALAVAAVALCGIGTNFGDAAQAHLPSTVQAAQHYFRLTPIFAISFAFVGALIVWRRPSNRIGWVCCGIGILWALEECILGLYSYAAYAVHPAAPEAHLLAWLTGWIWIPPVTLTFFFLPFLFPDGQPVSPRWRPLAWVVLAAMVLGIAGAMTSVTALSLPAQVVELSCAVLASCTLVIRYRRAQFEERQQIKWFAAAALLLAGLTVVSTGVSFLFYHNEYVVFNPVGGIALPLGLALLAAAIGIAVLRYHLYDIGVFLRRALVYAALLVLIGAIYLVLVVAIGTRISPQTTADRAIPFVVAAVLALILLPVRSRLQRLANRLVYGKRASPYEVLANFSQGVSELYGDEDLTVRMARVLAEGTEADRAEVWLRVGDQFRLAASWPAGAQAASLPLEPGGLPRMPDAAAAVPVQYHGELLGALAVVKREDLTPIETRLISDLAHEAGLVLKNERLTAELSQRLEELTVSRQRLVTAQDTERRRIERNLHDGAQQDLIALKLKLVAAEGMAVCDPQQTREMLGGLVTDVGNAVETLRELARGIYPAILADLGLAAALEAQAARSPLAVEVHAASLRRYPLEVEAAVYFCCLEALQNAVKHAHATTMVISVEESGGELRFTAIDDGQGIDVARARSGSGIQNMMDRMAALQGSLDLGAARGGGTMVSGRLPVRAERETPA